MGRDTLAKKETGPSQDAPAVHATLRVLTYLAGQRGPVAASVLVRELGVPRSALYRILRSLVEHGYAIHYPELRRYGLGYAAFELSSGFTRQEPLSRLAGPVVAALVDRVGESAHLAVLSGTDVIYLIEERATHRPALVTDIGVRLPASLTASGKAMLAVLPRPQLRALYRSTAPVGADGPVSYRTLVGELEVVRQAGFAVEDEGVAVGLASLAVAVSDRSGWPVASITLTVPRNRHPRETWPRLAQLVAIHATELSRRIGSAPSAN